MVTENYTVKVKVDGARQIEQLNASTIKIQNSLGGIGSAARLAGGALAAIGAAKISRSFLNTARSMETLSQRFKFLFGDAQEGAKAFEALNRYAATVPFSLDEIAAASGVLAVVSKDAAELEKNLGLTGNVAAVTGLDFKTAGEQIQRALSGGIGAADLLREKGVKNLLGFKDGVKYTTQETAEALQRVFGPDGKFGKASIALASTFDGLVSMVGDKMIQFQKKVMDSGPFDFLKAAVATVNDELSANFGSIEEAAKKIGAGIVSSAETIIVGAGYIIDAMMPVFKVFQESYNNILRATENLPTGIKTLGVIGFLMLGLTGKLIVVTIGAIIDNVMGLLGTLYGAMGKAVGGLGDLISKVPGLGSIGTYMKEAGDIAQAEGEKMKNAFKKVEDGAKGAEMGNLTFLEEIQSGKIVLGEYGQKLYDLVLRLREKQEEMRKTQEEADKLKKAIQGTGEATKASAITMENFKKTFVDSFNQMYEKFEPMKEGVKLLFDSFDTLKKGIGDAFADAILGAKNLSQAIGDLAKQIFRQLISGIIQLALEIWVFDKIREKVRQQKQEQDKLNASLGRELGLRTAIAAISMFTGGGGGFFGFLAEGGPAKQNKPYIVGERGPELFVPNTSGQVMPNDQISIGGGEATGDVNINFNIQTVDATGFDDLLLSRRGLITGIINEGVTRQGRKALI
jgi:hypothetical protein